MQTNTSLKISIIDDDPLVRVMLEDYFNEKYQRVELSSYATGEEAVANISEAPDLVVLDYNLNAQDKEGMNGIDVLKKLNEKFPGVAVIFLSGQEKSEVAANTLKHGAKDYIIKNDKLFQRLEVTLNNSIVQAKQETGKPTQKRGVAVTLIIIILLLLAMFIWNKMNA